MHYLTPPPLQPLNATDPHNFDIIIKDMTDVVHSPGGTAQRIGLNSPYKIAGKTGTAQVKSVAQGERYIESRVAEQNRDHALFIAFAPADDPKIALAIIVENGGHGGSVAAPIARKLMDYYLLGKEDMSNTNTAATAVQQAPTTGD